MSEISSFFQQYGAKRFTNAFDVVSDMVESTKLEIKSAEKTRDELLQIVNFIVGNAFRLEALKRDGKDYFEGKDLEFITREATVKLVRVSLQIQTLQDRLSKIYQQNQGILISKKFSPVG